MKKLLLFLVLISYGLVAQTPIYKFSFNGNVIDDTGNHIFDSGTGLTNITYVNDRFGNSSGALRMKNKTPIRTNAGLTALPQGTNPRSISVWVSYLDMNPANDVVVGGYGTETNSNFCGIYQQDNRVTAFSWLNDVNSPIGERYKFKNYGNNWYHYVLTYDGTTVKVFRNGNLVISDIPASPWNTNGFRIILGSIGSTVLAGGEFMAYDDLEVYNTVLTEAQIQAMYASQNPTNTTDLVAYFPFNGNLNSHDGSHTFVNMPSAPAGTYTSGYNGQGLMFNGTQGFQNSSIASVMNNNNFTVAFWQKRSQLPVSGLAVGEIPVEAFGSLGVGEKFDTSARDLAYLNYTASSSLTSFKPFDKDLNEWYHVAVQFVDLGNVDYMFYYVNGEFVNAVEGVINQNFSLHRFHNLFTIGMGTDNSGNPTVNKAANCEIDELYVFNRVLSVPEIMALRYQTLSAPCPTGNVTLTTQAEVDALASCTTISGDLTINPSGAVLDLTPLNNITNIDGVLNVISLGNTGTISFLNNVTSIGGGVIFNNLTASSIEGFNGITTLPFLAVTNCNNLSFFNAFPNLNQITLGNLEFFNCPLLTTIISLSSLTEVNKINIVLCHSLTNLNFLNSLTTYIGPFVRVALVNNNNLTDITELNSISGQSLSEVVITDNLSLSTCAVDWVCDYLATASPNATISGNAIGCESVAAVNTACAALSCPSGDVTLTTQAEVDALASCSTISGFLNINANNAALDLSPLNNITTINGALTVQGLTNNQLNIFPNLTTVTGSIQIRLNTFTEFSGFNNLTTASNGLQVLQNSNLTSFSGFNSLNFINGSNLGILLNNNLATINAFSNLQNVQGLLIRNTQLTNLSFLSSLTGNGGQLSIENNPLLTSANFTNPVVHCFCTGISGGDYVRIQSNPLLTTVGNVTLQSNVLGDPTIEFFQINNNPLLSSVGMSLDASATSSSVVNNLTLSSNSNLANLSFFNDINLTSTGSLSILSLPITSLSALSSLTNISAAITLTNNTSLTDISGLNNININNLTGVNINSNIQLATCEVDWLCDYLSTTSPNTIISGNATGCESETAVNTACAALSTSVFDLASMSLYPNPTDAIFSIVVPNEVVKQVRIFDVTGKMLLDSQQTTINVSSFSSGIYMINIETESGKIGVSKLIKK